MRHGGGFRALAALLLIGFIGILTAGAYGAGFTAGSGSSATPPAPWAYGGAFGAGHFFGFLIGLFALLIVIRLLVVAFGGGHRHHMWASRHGWGPGGFGPGGFGPGGFGPGGSGSGNPGDAAGWERSEWRRVGESAFDDWHRRSHERSGAGTQPGAEPGTTGNPPAAGS